MLHHKVLAGALVVKAPEAEIGFMVIYFPVYPYSCEPNDMMAAMYYEKERYDFMLDLQVKGEYPYYTKKLFGEMNIHLNIESEYLEILKAYPVNFISFSYHGNVTIAAEKDKFNDSVGNMVHGVKNLHIPVTEWGWEIDAQGLRIESNRHYKKYYVPLFVVENGLGAVDILENDNVQDDYRIHYLRTHIEKLKKQ